MHSPMRFLAGVLAAAVSTAAAATYPDRPLRLIVPYAPGGGTEIDKWAKVAKAAKMRAE